MSCRRMQASTASIQHGSYTSWQSVGQTTELALVPRRLLAFDRCRVLFLRAHLQMHLFRVIDRKLRAQSSLGNLLGQGVTLQELQLRLLVRVTLVQSELLEDGIHGTGCRRS